MSTDIPEHWRTFGWASADRRAADLSACDPSIRQTACQLLIDAALTQLALVNPEAVRVALPSTVGGPRRAIRLLAAVVAADALTALNCDQASNWVVVFLATDAAMGGAEWWSDAAVPGGFDVTRIAHDPLIRFAYDHIDALNALPVEQTRWLWAYEQYRAVCG